MNNIEASQLQEAINNGYYTPEQTLARHYPVHPRYKHRKLFEKTAATTTVADIAEIKRLVDDFDKELAAYNKEHAAYCDLARKRTQEFWRDCSVAAGTYLWGESLLALIRSHVESVVGMTDSAARGPTWNLKWEIYQDVVELLKLARTNM